MAESRLFWCANSVLHELDSTAIRKACGKKDRDKLKCSIRKIQDGLLDAEKKQDKCALVKDWIRRADDLLCELAELLRVVDLVDGMYRRDMWRNILIKVRIFLSKLNPNLVENSVPKEVKAITKRLGEISGDVKMIQSLRETKLSGLSNDLIIGRGDDKRAIMEFLLNHSDFEQSVSVIVIVGAWGIGKTSLAQLVYDNIEVQNHFENKWWAWNCSTNLIESIADSMESQFHHAGDSEKLISESVVSGGKYLLVLDDVRDADRDTWSKIMFLLTKGTKGSKIIVTTRLPECHRAMQNDGYRIHTLNGLAEENSWELFQRIAFSEYQENDTAISLGREIVRKCHNTPLAIKTIATYLSTKYEIEDWRSAKCQMQGGNGHNTTMSVLKMSYDALPSSLKQCFAYCFLFPKDYIILKEKLMYLWIAQGYVKPRDHTTVEEEGHACFMSLLRISLLQKIKVEDNDNNISCKMLDVYHDLAQSLAGEEIIVLVKGLNQFSKKVLHVSMQYEMDNPWTRQLKSLKANCLSLISCLEVHVASQFLINMS